MTTDSIFLIFAAMGLIPIALSYGAKPSSILTPLFGFPVESPNLTHVFRAIMGLYLAFACFWITGALLPQLTVAALWSLVIFMFGLAVGRALSLVLDGRPHWLDNNKGVKLRLKSPSLKGIALAVGGEGVEAQ